MNPHIYGFLLILIGIVYIIKPNIFRIGFWKKTDVAQQLLSPTQYTSFMRILGGLCIGIGSYFVIFK